MRHFPDYQYIMQAANNIQPKRIPLYEHNISDIVMERILGDSFRSLLHGNAHERREYFAQYNRFFCEMGYDTVSFERCITQILPGGGALGEHADPVIKTMSDFEMYPWDMLEDEFFQAFEDDFCLLDEMMPEGMKAIGGPGNGVFEIVQDLCGFENLCYIRIDEPELYEAMFQKVTDVMIQIWKRFLDRFSDAYCVFRFGDDLGFKTQTLLSTDDIRMHLIPRYKEIVELIHGYEKPFLLHSCGAIFPVMDDLIDIVKIDAKHSNEDCIAPFSKWLDGYGSRIGNFGGVDVDVLCTKSEKEIVEYVSNVYHNSLGHGGVAIGSGNSIPEYVPEQGYLAMVNTVRDLRG